MTATTALTELDALNMMLTAADEAPVQTASQPGHLPLSIAKGVLNDVVRTVLTVGWSFNTESEFPLTIDVNNQIPIAPNVLSVDVDDKWTKVDPVQRGLRLYDKKSHSYTFTESLTGTVILLLTWDEIPQPVRQYIAIRAARAFQVRMQAGDTVYKLTEADEQAALLAAQSYEADAADANFLTDSWSVAQVLQGRTT